MGVPGSQGSNSETPTRPTPFSSSYLACGKRNGVQRAGENKPTNHLHGVQIACRAGTCPVQPAHTPPSNSDKSTLTVCQRTEFRGWALTWPWSKHSFVIPTPWGFRLDMSTCDSTWGRLPEKEANIQESPEMGRGLQTIAAAPRPSTTKEKQQHTPTPGLYIICEPVSASVLFCLFCLFGPRKLIWMDSHMSSKDMWIINNT